MPCPNDDCESHDSGRTVIVFENGKGTLSFTCDKCSASQYARPGQKVHEHWRRRMAKGKAEPERPPASKPASAAPVAVSPENATEASSAPGETQPRTGFSLGKA